MQFPGRQRPDECIIDLALVDGWRRKITLVLEVYVPASEKV